MDIEKLSRDVFDEMRRIIAENRISDQAFLSAIARGMHAAVEDERKACADAIRRYREEEIYGVDDPHGYRLAEKLEEIIRARGGQ